MSLTKTDKKDIIMIVNGAIEELVLPRFDSVEKDIVEIKEDLADVQFTVNRIETLQKSELNHVDDHEIRIGKIEKATA